MYTLSCALRLVLLPFLTTATAFIVTAPPATRTALAPAQRTKYGAYGPQETFFQIQPTLDREQAMRKREYTTLWINTCGWTSRDVTQPKTCPAGLGCGWIKGDESYENGVVCVPYDDIGELNWADAQLPTKCVGYGGLNVTIAEAYSLTYGSTLWCGASATACATAVFDGGPASISGVSTSFAAFVYTSMFCTTEVTRVTVFQTVTNSLPPSQSSSSSSSSFPVTSSTSQSSGPPKDQSSGTSSSASNSATPLPKSSDPTPTGEIAGATVGGVLGVAAIAGLAGFLLWRRKHNQRHTPLELSRAPSEMDYAHPNPYMDSPQYRMAYMDSSQNRMAYPPQQTAYSQQQTAYLPHMDFGDQGPYAENRPFIGRAV